MPQLSAEFDIIFAGGGTAACVIAGRLAAADPSLTILVVEAGPHTLNNTTHTRPALFMNHMTPESKTMKFLVSNPSPFMGGKPAIVPAPQCVGGGSSLNFMMYNRVSASEYDDWETKFDNPGWGFCDLIPLLRKTETYESDVDAETHGSSGPLKVTWGGHFTNVSQDFLDVAAQYDKERGLTADTNDTTTVNRYGRFAKWIGSSGQRSDVPHHFIYNQKENKNLCILAGYYIQHGLAVGVEYIPNLAVHPNAIPSESISAYARKLVIVSGGSLGSPLILERSGIGASSVLQKHGIKQIVDLPGVGERYQDHQVTVPVCRASDESDTLDGIFRGDPDELAKWNAQWERDGTGLMASNGIDVGIKFRPTEDEVKAIGPAFQEKWKSYYVKSPDKPIYWSGIASFFFGTSLPEPKQKYYGVATFLSHPSSLGHIHITSSEDPSAPPDFTPGYLEHEEDMEIHVFAYKRGREFARRMACYRGEHPPQQPAFAKDSPAAVNEEPFPVGIDAPVIQYTQEDDEAIRNFVRQNVNTVWHALGTCAMMPRERGGVVDSRLNVYGVRGLKVADLSIAPINVSANTYSTTLVIAEKAALIIAEDLKISGV
ncbi:hypothetical protein EIP91_001104 [Steccherinum ochraceum]|uniref:Glucose-methanol-choline oxidoreductase N-terminal domain-containing protein n=1 Tax=Steccherinum ochraceum TaxID=92696 RepID=A0A4V2MWK9_9APHY|nr:hypothetical protein EIP91_001104 [Steccherinum ochraceum]